MKIHGIPSQIFGSSRAHPTADRQEFRSTLRSLIDAIKDGELDKAKEAYATIEEAPAGKTGTNSHSPFAQLIAQLGETLGADDLEAAKGALSTFEAHRPEGPPPAGGPRKGGPWVEERSAFGDLVESLRSDDLSGAKDAYAKLLEARGDEETSGKSPIDRFLEQIGVALESNDLDSAQSALDQLARHHPHGGAVDVST